MWIETPNVGANRPGAAGRLGPGWENVLVPQAGPSWPAVEGPVERRVRRRVWG